MRVALVACCGRKLPHAAPAGELYCSVLFRKAAAVARRQDRWFILSALHGLVEPAAVVAPYNFTLTEQSREYRAAWGRRVAAALRELGLDGGELLALAGAAYCDPLEAEGIRLIRPLRGMGIGEQLAYLSR